jgi:hypothetical protein
MGERNDYNARYYSTHKDELRKQRRKRYVDDPEYASRCRVAAAHARTREVIKPRGDVPRHPVSVDVNGVEMAGYSIGHLATSVDRTVLTLKVWERMGRLPKTPLHTESGFRLYTQDMIDVVVRVVRRFPRGNAQKMFVEIVDGWRACGVRIEEGQHGED